MKLQINILDEVGMPESHSSAFLKALQAQVSEDFAPLYGLDAELTWKSGTKVANDNAFWLVLLHNSDQAGALGYHDMTNAGLPLGKVFVDTVKQYGETVSVTMSHELLEMMADPWINKTATVRNQLVMYEVCDPCQDEQFSYDQNGVKVSDFVTPAWFDPTWTPKGIGKFHWASALDFRGHIQCPFELLHGGYIGVRNLGGGGWRQETRRYVGNQYLDYEKLAVRHRPGIGSRRERRMIGHEHWRLSTISHRMDTSE